MDLEDLHGVLPVLVAGVEHHVEQAGENHAGNQAHNDHVKQAVDIDVHLFTAVAGVNQSQQKAHRDDDSVPIDTEPANGEGHRVHGELQPQVGECDVMRHESFLLRPKTVCF